MEQKHKKQRGCIKTSPACIEWDLCDIPCLGIKTGDTLDDITFSIVRRICELSSPLDLSSISIECLIDKFKVVEPLNKTIATFLQLVIDNQCSISDLITAINNRIDHIASPTLILDLKCLKVLDSAGNQLPYTTQTVLQNLINEACLIRDAIAGLSGAISNINIRIDNIPAPYQEPAITAGCVYSGTRPLSQGFSILASDYCTFKTAVGTTSQIQTAIGRQPATLNVDFATDLNFVQSPSTLAQSDNNQWILLDALYKRLKALEDCACKKTCADIIIGFITEFTESNTVILKFTSGAGTFIPVGYKDCGSVLTISNEAGIKSLPYNIIISQEGETQELDISMFRVGEYLTFNVEVKLCSKDLNCEKCVTKVVRNTSGCCLITNTSTVPITITYQSCSSVLPPSKI